ncbi:hypothetical protein PHMEG_0002797 [Phytophthora megakarya]|uniref:Uncharacterized protein n=1 Tax=Phytophthora megakarya TaxID=4795 RepID=A0A225WY72_9STRA|nr:hypothetical protein PHMEG_0002797 [Phytophthora megakarya]
MLRASRHARRPASQRLIWSRASDFVAWLGLNPNTEEPPTTRNEASSAAKHETPSPPNRLTAKRVLRPQPPVDATYPTFQSSLDPTKRRDAANALGRFSQKVKHVTTSKQLLEAWQVVSQCRPFVVDSEGSFRVRLATAEDVSANCPWLMQIVPADVFAQLSADIVTRSMFVGKELEADVVVTNEALMVGNLIKAFHRMNEHKLAVAFFEAYDRDRSVWLQEHQLREAAKVSDDECSDVDNDSSAETTVTEKTIPIENVTQLPRAVYSSYIHSLAALKQSKKIVRLFEDDEHQLERICSTVPNLYLLLHACYSERNGELARRCIDTITRCSPAAVIPLGCYELAVRANLRDRKRNERELLTAIHLAKTLYNDGGYILKPDIWSGLIKVSLNMDRPDLALEVFKSYPRHCIPEYQSHFRQVLRAACRPTDSTALDMMHFCWFKHNDEYSDAKTVEERKVYEDTICLNTPDNRGLSLEDAVLASNISTVNKEAETELLNMMLWEMLKHRHVVPSLVEVVDLMESTRSKGGAIALRQTVLVMFEYDMKQKKMSARAALENSLKFWGDRPSVLSGQGFLVHLLLEECVERQWDDECEFLVDYLLDLGVSRVPLNTIIKMMGTNEVRGRFEANSRIGDKLLQKLSNANRVKLREDFYERYLMSCLRLEQFAKVSEEYAKFNLEKRYPHNEVIRTILQDAAAQ